MPKGKGPINYHTRSRSREQFSDITNQWRSLRIGKQPLVFLNGRTCDRGKSHEEPVLIMWLVDTPPFVRPLQWQKRWKNGFGNNTAQQQEQQPQPVVLKTRLMLNRRGRGSVKNSQSGEEEGIQIKVLNEALWVNQVKQHMTVWQQTRIYRYLSSVFRSISFLFFLRFFFWQ